MNNVGNTIETPLFSDYTGWDELDVSDLQFYDAVLKVDIGPCKAGDTISCIMLLMQTSQIQLMDDAGNVLYTGELVLSIKDIDPDE